MATFQSEGGQIHHLGEAAAKTDVDTKRLMNNARKRKLTIQRGDGETNEAQFQQQLNTESYFRVVIDGDEGGLALKNTIERLQKAVDLRKRYDMNLTGNNVFVQLKKPVLRHGVFVFPNDAQRMGKKEYGHRHRLWHQYAEDVQDLLFTAESTNCRKACEHRLGIIQERSRMFFSLNSDVEADIMDLPSCQKAGGVFSTATKVDNSCRLTCLMNAQELLEFVQDYHQRYPHEVVGKAHGGSSNTGNLVLQEVFDEYGIKNPKELTVTGLDWHQSHLEADVESADAAPEAQAGSPGSPRSRPGSFGRNHPSFTQQKAGTPKKPPLGQVLLKYFSSLKGLPFPMVLKKVLKRRDDRNSRYLQAAEYKISVYGASADELNNIATFFRVNDVGPFERTKWVLHLKFKDRVSVEDHMGKGLPYANCQTLQDQISNIFQPLITATIGDSQQYPALASFLPQVGAIHLESLRPTDEEFELNCPPPDEIPFNPMEAEGGSDAEGGMDSTFASVIDKTKQIESKAVRRRAANQLCELYYDYYVWANLCTLNQLRDKKGLEPIQLRRGGGEGVGINSLLGGYLIADMVTNGAKMAEHPVLQYLYGMHRIGVSVAPIYDDQRQTTPYNKTPISTFLHRSLRVCISTEEPLHLHTNFDPLLEEYGTCQKLCRLTPLDMTELARNSVLVSTFSRTTKEDWLGARFRKQNCPGKSQVSDCRLEFRRDVWMQEATLLEEIRAQKQSIKDGGDAGGQKGATAWSNLSSVTDVEYHQVIDTRIRFPRTVIFGPQKRDKITHLAAPLLGEAVAMRKRYIWEAPKPWFQRHDIVEEAFRGETSNFNEKDWTFAPIDSVFCAFPSDATKSWPSHIATLKEFAEDFKKLRRIVDSIECKDFSYRRLELLESKFRLHLALNHANEAGTTDSKASSNRDLYHSFKVDTHVHMAAGMTARSLRDFIAEKVTNHPDDIVMEDRVTKKVLTLQDMMSQHRIAPETLTTDQLNVHADHTLFERFDNFNNKYNPMAIQDLRTILLKTENYMNGRYFAELIQNTFDGYTRDRYTFAENRLSIYGSKESEWSALADWFATHGMASKHNRWIIQVPRVTYTVFHKFRTIASFGDYLRNLFKPLWEASLNPAKHPRLHHFLNHVAGFDSVDNEATFDAPFQTTPPEQWRTETNPPYGYHMYHLWANIRTLNEFRSFRGFPPLAFRPHCGESGADDHLLYTFLTADGINHGVNLRNDPAVQYLYYLTQVGLAVSPLSNNALFVYFLENPFPDFFRRGLNVSLSTDDPLMFHQTSEPLIEEYSIAAKVWGLSQNDLCEIARNSVLQSGFDPKWKANAIGDQYFMSSSLGNDSNKTHLSDIRVSFRFETYHTEVAYLQSVVKQFTIPRKMYLRDEEQVVTEHQLRKQVEHVLLTTHDQAMEVISRDLEDKKKGVRTSLQVLESLRKQNRNLLENISEVGQRLDADKAEKEEEERRRKMAPVKYEKATKRELGQHLLLQQALPKEELNHLMEWQPRPPTGDVAHGGGHKQNKVLVPPTSGRPLPKVPIAGRGRQQNHSPVRSQSPVRQSPVRLNRHGDATEDEPAGGRPSTAPTQAYENYMRR